MISNKKRKSEETLSKQLMTKISDLVAQIDNIVDELDGVVSDKMQKGVDVDLTAIVESCQKMLNNSKKAAGEYLHDLPQEKPEFEDVKKVINLFPNALLHKNKEGHLPIQTALEGDVGSEKYLCFLAMQASQHNIAPERCGVLFPISRQFFKVNILQGLCCLSEKSSQEYLNVLKELRCAGLLPDEFIVQEGLMGWTTHKGTITRLEYLVSICPQALSIILPSGDLPIQNPNYDLQYPDIFRVLLKAGMRHYPDSFGFLFKRSGTGRRPITQAISKYGKKETLQTIQEIILPNEEHPILHYVIRYTPKLIDYFIQRYPRAVHLKDRKGRHLLHVSVKSGFKLSGHLLMMIHSNKACIAEKDPVTNLYPFMLAATSGRNKKSLTTVYMLLSLRPEIISKCIDKGGME